MCEILNVLKLVPQYLLHTYVYIDQCPLSVGLNVSPPGAFDRCTSYVAFGEESCEDFTSHGLTIKVAYYCNLEK
jgi:hypothetical protein